MSSDEDNDEFETASDHSDGEDAICTGVEQQFLIKDLDSGQVINLLEDSDTAALTAPLTQLKRASLKPPPLRAPSPAVPGRRVKVSHHQISEPVLTAIQELQTVKDHIGAIWAFARSPDKKQLASVGRDTIVRLWNVGDRLTPATTHTGHTADILDISWGVSGFLVTASADGTARIWHPTQETAVETLTHPAHVMSADIHPRMDQYVVTAAADGMLRLIDAESRKVLAKIQTPGMPTVVRFCPGGTKLVVGTMTGHLKVYDAVDLRPLTGWHKPTVGRFTGIAFPDENSIIAASADCRIRVFSADTLLSQRTFLGHTTKTTVSRPSTTTSGDLICSGGDTSWVYLWPRHYEYVPTINPVFTRFRRDKSRSYMKFKVDTPVVCTMAIGPSALEAVRIITGDEDGTIRLYGHGSLK
ncbi:Ankyrin repeats (3 copies) [Carpediemonas membranifera]|uniref:Ankyrin repeats (3 copies) n=1 Tax=Carpediemonas membranifera TaxID=201153 RepID=A0A8J6B092_9EUKA|nr:Ankyrin repeats (3 copies) [Carpediemonas membranifera]|eukprot:KAG9391474.1 Ankyrin repeats (3 copies) [Carpediemonas membranifera]